MLVSERSFRTFLVVGSGAVALIFWVLALSIWMRNIPLRPLAEAKILGWEVEEVRSDRFALRARYTYAYNGDVHRGETLFEPLYLNEISAISGLKDAAGRSWSVWLDPAHPERSSLEKVFPAGLLTRAAVATLVLFYFCFSYVKKYF